MLQRNLLAGLFLVVAGVGVYWQVQSFPFVSYDDPLYVYENAQVRLGLTLDGLLWALTSTDASNWHPLTWLSHMLDVEFFGADAAGRHHTSSVVLHVLNSLLVFAVLKAMTGSHWRSLFVASIFTLHPLHVESVAWVSERKDVLSQFFWLLSIWAYSRYAASGDRRWYAATALGLVCGLMSKPMLVTAPFLFLLLDYWPLGRWRGARWENSGNAQGIAARRLLLEKLPFFAMSVLSSVVTYQAQITGQSVVALPLWHRLATVVTAYVRYVGKTLWPGELAIFYPNHVGMWSAIQVGASIALLLTVTVGVMRIRRQPYLRVGWFWFLGTLVPVVGFVGIGGASMADRYMYMPMTGLLIMLAWGSVELSGRATWMRPVVSVAAAVTIGVCGVLSLRQVQYWSSSRTLFEHALAVTRDNHVMHNNLGTVLEVEGDLPAAALEYQKASRVAPTYSPAHINLGNVYKQQGRIDEAIAAYLRAAAISPTRPDVYRRLGNAQLRKGQMDVAIGNLRKAVRRLPQDVMAYHDLGLALAMRGDVVEAESVLREGLLIDPNSAWLHTTLGNVYRAQGRGDDAVREHRLALRTAPQAGAYSTLGVSLLAIGETDEAITQFRAALRLDPTHAEAHGHLNRALGLPAVELQ